MPRKGSPTTTFTLLLEAINTSRHARLLLSIRKLIRIRRLSAVDAPNLRMQMDLYHMQVMEGDLAIKLKPYQPHCGHVQIAGAPTQ